MEGNDLAALSAYTGDSGEGRWTIEDAMAKDVPTPVITASLYARFYSRGNGEFTGKVLSALRAQFGGHATQRRADGGGASRANRCRGGRGGPPAPPPPWGSFAPQ